MLNKKNNCQLKEARNKIKERMSINLNINNLFFEKQKHIKRSMN
jgi:hypothetical protein